MEIEIKEPRIEKLKEKVAKVKEHIKNNKHWYMAAGGALLGAGVAAAAMKTKQINSGDASGSDLIKVQPLALMAKQFVDVDITQVIHRGNQGPPSYITRDKTTGDEWLSHRATCKARKIPDGLLASHLRGDVPDIDGHQYERVGIAIA